MFKFFFGMVIGGGLVAMIASARPSDTQKFVRSSVDTAATVAGSALNAGQKAAHQELSHN